MQQWWKRSGVECSDDDRRTNRRSDVHRDSSYFEQLQWASQPGRANSEQPNGFQSNTESPSVQHYYYNNDHTEFRVLVRGRPRHGSTRRVVERGLRPHC